MLDDFFVRALVAGTGLALIAGPLGCFVVWRRMAYFGDTMAHSALLGIVVSILLDWNLSAGVFVVAVLVALALAALGKNRTLSSDTLLGILSHTSLAGGLVLISLMPFIRVDLMGFLFGDILSVSRTDVALIYGFAILASGILILFWRPLIASTLSEELAGAEGLKPGRAKLVLMLLLALVIGVAIKLVGVLLITSLLIIPAATARRLSGGPEQMVLIASLAGAISVVGGLLGSAAWDTPSGPSIVVAAALLFAVSLMAPGRKSQRGRKTEHNK